MKPSTRRVRDRLRQGPATTHDLCQPEVGGVRFGGRVKELRDLGYGIDRKLLRAGSHLYTLIAEPETSPSPAPAAAGDTPAPLLGVHPAARAPSSDPCLPDLSSAASACPAGGSLLGPPAAAFEGLGQANTSGAKCAIDDDYDWEDQAA